MKTIIIDNYDSFTYNLAHLASMLGADADVVRNDRFALGVIEQYDNIILSPGPGIPSEAGRMPDVIKHYSGRKPILGVCLGHQAIAEAFGATLTNLTEVFHGVQTDCRIVRHDKLLEGLPETIKVGRYHSWVVNPDNLPSCIEVTAVSPEGHIMALHHRTMDIYGIQFHPESVLTPCGEQIMRNFLNINTNTNL